MRVEFEREEDGRWIGEGPALPGVVVYGATEKEASAKIEALAFRVIANRIEHGDPIPSGAPQAKINAASASAAKQPISRCFFLPRSCAICALILATTIFDPANAGAQSAAQDCAPDAFAKLEADKSKKSNDDPVVFGEYQRLADCGDARAQHRLGDLYYTAIGVAGNLDKARAWYLKAAKQGHVESQFNLGVMYFKGLGVRQDYAQARQWYLKAAEQGHANAQNEIGAMLHAGQGGERNEKEALLWFLKSAEQGFAQGQNNAGVAYAAGYGTKKDYAEARKWYLKAAEQGFAQAQFHLGGLYAQGQGVTRDRVEAVFWYRKAAAQGDAEAQYNLGAAYRNGNGVPPDYVEAVGLWLKAAQQGHTLAQNRMMQTHLVLGMFGQRDRADLVKAYMWAILAERNACAQARMFLGQDAAALTTDQRAKREVCAEAPRFRNAVSRTLKPDEIAKAEGLARTWKPGGSGDTPPSAEALRAVSHLSPPRLRSRGVPGLFIGGRGPAVVLPPSATPHR